MQIKLAKPKALPAKRNQRLKDNSSGSSAGEEAKEEELVAEEELVVPTKGKEIPRTPPVGGKNNVNGEEFRKPKPARSPRSQALSAVTTGIIP